MVNLDTDLTNTDFRTHINDYYKDNPGKRVVDPTKKSDAKKKRREKNLDYKKNKIKINLDRKKRKKKEKSSGVEKKRERAAAQGKTLSGKRITKRVT